MKISQEQFDYVYEEYAKELWNGKINVDWILWLTFFVMKGDDIMGRPKGGKNREWSKDQKYEIIKCVIDGEKSINDLGREFGINNGMIWNWLKRYNEKGIEGLENKRKPGNPLAKYSHRKKLTPIEKLEYENMLLRIENERLKKGYTEEDVLLALEKLSEKNTK